MSARKEFPRLQQKLGDDGMLDLHDQLTSKSREWKKDVLETADDRFERRMSEELAKMRSEISKMHISILRWMFAFWVTALAANFAMFHFGGR